MEVVAIKKRLTPNLLIYVYLHCVRSLSWCATTLATLVRVLYSNALLSTYTVYIIHCTVWVFSRVKKHYILINITPWNKSLTCFQLVFRNMFSCLIVQLLLKEGAAKSMKFMIDWFQKCHSFRSFSCLVKHKLVIVLLKFKFSNKKLCVNQTKESLM